MCHLYSRQYGKVSLVFVRLYFSKIIPIVITNRFFFYDIRDFRKLSMAKKNTPCGVETGMVTFSKKAASKWDSD